MSGAFRAAVWTEALKARRSLALPVTAAAMTLAGLVGGFFMFVLEDPDRARSLGLLGAKASLTGATADWPGYFSLVAQMTAVGGLLVFGVVVIWVFGREFSDRTFKDLLALPTPRPTIVAAKLVVASLWCLSLTLLLLALTLLLGAALRLPGWSAAALAQGVATVIAVALLTLALVTVYAVAASVARGYLAAVGVMFLTLLSAQVVTALGYGAWYPWAVPSLVAGAGGDGQASPGLAGLLAVLGVGAAATLGTVLWWQRADHSR